MKYRSQLWPIAIAIAIAWIMWWICMCAHVHFIFIVSYRMQKSLNMLIVIIAMHR